MTPDLAASFARIALGHVEREYPHKADHVMDGDADAYIPHLVHPIFYGSFDWHSCIHGYWLLARVRRLFPELAEVAAIDALFTRAITPGKVEAERAYLDRPSARSFERPYGWAWALMLASELIVADSPHVATLQPLADAFVARFQAFLPKLHYPVRAGFHSNTAFALVLAERYARVSSNEAFQTTLREAALRWFSHDRGAQAWEPSGEDFLSPTLMEALAMHALLPAERFAPWFAAFLPDLAAGQPATLFTPARVSDRSDGKIAHLDGLNLSRAWAMRSLARSVSDVVASVLNAAAAQHLTTAIDEVAGDYMGEHWLASFAMLALTGTDGTRRR
ncbi:DUF2891 domain-containing protein [Sphingomonas sp. TDK1]|uniref:DUF2891 domain-containing protein n=1 Tax=Sphingomonas sp. TDK1 TaxID=453247 RepID=UPI0007D9BADA|nr:DUF2891 domain-containing protein [Sphingomonas sp. TDK1]OAN63558.1 hypothetical protein A7X12_20070 [Sphingomonas sp. TDK1]